MPEFLRSIAHTLRALVWRRKADRDLDDEIGFHVEMETALNVRNGMTPEDARRAALLRFGGVQRYKEQYRSERGSRRIERIAQDMRYAARRLVRERGFSIPAIAALGVGMGATVAIVALADAVILRPLPYPESHRLVAIGHRAPADGALEGGQSEATYLHYVANTRSFEALGIYFDRDLSITDGEQPERVTAALMTPSVFEALGVPAMLGTYCPRFASPAEEASGNARIVISHELWRRRYAGDPQVVGRGIEINRGARTIVGVMPADFHFPRLETQLWFCQPISPAAEAGTSTSQLGVARLKPGVTPEAAEADLRRAMATFAEVFPAAAQEMARSGQTRPVLTPLKDATIGDVRPAVVLLACTAVLVLLISWANAANLVLVRSESQRRQIAVERALGATTGDVAQRHLCEAALLSLGAGVLAWTIARLAVASRFGFAAGEIPRLHELRADGRVLALAVAFTVLTAILVGGTAFVRTRGTTVLAALRGTAGRARTSIEWRRVQRGLVVAQVSLALTLLIASGVMVQSYRQLSQFTLGFDPSSVLAIEVPLPFRGYSRYEHGARLFDEALARVRSLPGVTAAEAASARLPLVPLDAYAYTPATTPDAAEAGAGPRVTAALAIVTPGWFDAMRIPITRGRTYRPGDLRSSDHPVVVSAAFARALFGTDDALGRRVALEDYSSLPMYTIVGIVGDVPGDRIPDGPSRTIYFPVLRDFAAIPDSTPRVPLFPGEMTLFVRTSGAPMSLIAPIRRIVGELDPHVPVTNARTLEDVVRGSTARARLTMLLLLAGASAALVLGVIGIYGVVSYSVSQRTPEIGIRMALGATPSRVNAMVLVEAAGMTALGAGVGVIASLAATRLLSGLLFGVSATEPMTFVAMVILLSGTALGASYIPARRASRIDPVGALRAE